MLIFYVVVSGDPLRGSLRARNHFMLVHEGWENHRRVHGFIVHAEIRIELVAAGVPKEHTGYALAYPLWKLGLILDWFSLIGPLVLLHLVLIFPM